MLLGLTDLERAVRFYYLQKSGFGGKVTGQNFGVDFEQGGRFNIYKFQQALQCFHERLAGVLVEHLDFEAFIDKYNKPETLFYLDPPYYGNETDYGKELFSREDFERLASSLKRVKGRFILSLNDCKEVRQIFKDFKIEGVKTTYSLSKKGGKK